ncbi:hypothetical protein MRX96_025194 [Rhipicephalus microplus]
MGTSATKSVHICCRNGSRGACLPAIEHGLKSLDGRLFVQRSDFFCHGRRGQCDGFGMCIVSPMISHSSGKSAARTLPTPVANFVSLILVPPLLGRLIIKKLSLD